VHLGEELVDPRAAGVERGPVAVRPAADRAALLMKLTTSIRKPSTPRSSQRRIIA
jgi:hypothetical protein